MLSRALLLALLAPVSALQLAASVLMGSPTYASTGAASAVRMADGQDPLLLRAARGEEVERSPVWMMRQAGRHMQVYRDLVKDYPTFRERSEIPDVSFEVSMQPYRAYKTDGVILFSDILTPLPAMGVDFSISEGGAIAISPIRTREAFKKMTAQPFSPETECTFVSEVLNRLRDELRGTDATLLGFVGLPFTIGTYLVEGATGTKNNFAEMRALRQNDPELSRDILALLAERIAQYAIFQIDAGAQVVQVFDSWAGHLTPEEFAEWAMPFQRQVVSQIKEARPDVPVIIYMAPDQYSKGGKFIERLAQSGADVVSVDHTVDLADARAILDKAGFKHVGLQGNLDPAILAEGSPDEIVAAAETILSKAGNKAHVMNLGHGIEANTPEPSAALFIKTVQEYQHKKAVAA